MPHLTHPPFTSERQPQHRDHPTLIRIVRGFFNVPQNYEHSRNCETWPPVYRPYPKRIESQTICRWNYKGSTFLLSYLKTLSVGPVGVSESRTHDLSVSARCTTKWATGARSVISGARSVISNPAGKTYLGKNFQAYCSIDVDAEKYPVLFTRYLRSFRHIAKLGVHMRSSR